MESTIVGAETHELPILETPCPRCEGKGHFSKEVVVLNWDKCFNCYGSGHVPTEDGKRLLTFIAHNFKRLEGILQWED